MTYTNALHHASISYPNHPGSRTGSPETSEDAANAIAPIARNHRDKILAYLKSVYPTACSSEQIGQAVDLSHYAVRPRVSELVADDKVERTDDRETNERGRSVVLWRAV